MIIVALIQARATSGDEALVSFPSTWSVGANSNMVDDLDVESKAVNGIFDAAYDLYDPSTKELSERGMHCGVIKSRRRRLSFIDARLAPISDEPAEESPSPTEKPKQGRSYGNDVVTNWGVMVGKALWCRVTGQGDQRQRSKFGLLAASHQLPREDPEGAVPSKARKPNRAVRMAERRAKMVVCQMKAR
eukprot:gb/GFBE01011726.1/.p1 GENE.gb/GFBE01011726.1/~~gb/GFBE01011726.1/.p1  ORF type:complete len:189 (+),score=17.66 gb/GFBE01011726.1/:1-567(+)